MAVQPFRMGRGHSAIAGGLNLADSDRLRPSFLAKAGPCKGSYDSSDLKRRNPARVAKRCRCPRYGNSWPPEPEHASRH
jgi:hypothetical protein